MIKNQNLPSLIKLYRGVIYKHKDKNNKLWLMLIGVRSLIV